MAEAMKYRNLGRAGVKVAPLCLGTMMFGGEADEAEAGRVLDRALAAGLNFIDTSNSYNDGRSEEVLGRYLAERQLRDRVVLATKVYHPRGSGPNDRGLSRYHVRQEVERSLRRLKTDRIDLYQFHRPDVTTPLEESLRTIDDLVAAGKVLYFGTSCFPAAKLAELLALAERQGRVPVASEQPPYSILNREVEAEVLPYCAAHGIAVIPFSPLSGGWLSGKYRAGAAAPAGSRYARRKTDMSDSTVARRLAAVEGLQALAEQKGVGLIPLVVAWVMSRPGVTSPIIGPKSLAQLETYLAALDVTLTAEDQAVIDALVAPGTRVKGEG